MPASRKKIAKQEGFARTNGPRPLPPHFGEVDTTAPFDPHRFYTLLRSVGANPYLARFNEQGVFFYQSAIYAWPDVWHKGVSKLRQPRFDDAVAWFNAQDKDRVILKSFHKSIVEKKPAGDFIHYLGC